MSANQKMVLSVLVATSVTWGTMLKMFIYYNVSKENWRERPINVLTVAEMVSNHQRATTGQGYDNYFRRFWPIFCESYLLKKQFTLIFCIN
jgi:F0F1-type ATP synthase membrane subunit a